MPMAVAHHSLALTVGELTLGRPWLLPRRRMLGIRRRAGVLRETLSRKRTAWECQKDSIGTGERCQGESGSVCKGVCSVL
jgi:hypothetical protein